LNAIGYRQVSLAQNLGLFDDYFDSLHQPERFSNNFVDSRRQEPERLPIGEPMSDPVQPVVLINPDATASVVLVCEHASPMVPPDYGDLGVTQEVLQSHVAWDPGALAVAQVMAQRLQARLVAGGISRLVYDCNRPPEAPDAMPVKSEIYDIPGNVGLDQAAKARRVAQVYQPFRAKLAQVMDETTDPILVTIHSFTPIYHGAIRDLDIGILHDTDRRLAEAMLSTDSSGLKVARNQPYGPEHGVTHTLKEHALAGGHLNVMIEIRNDLIRTPAQQAHFGALMSDWVEAALAQIAQPEGASCPV
jgi:predicted N-formylglutamate amidohydrolase